MSAPPACYRNADLAERQFGDLARRYAAALNEADELAGAALAALDPRGVEGMDAVEAALNGDASEAPEPVRALFAAHEAPPFDVDHDQIERGARALMRHGRVAYAAATRQSLFWGYSNGAAIKPLAWTGEMRPARRGPAPPGRDRRLADGGDLARRASPSSRRLAGHRARPPAPRARACPPARLRPLGHRRLGRTLNRADSAFTLLEFTLMPLKLLRGLGFAFEADERAAIYALWRFVGHLVGVPPELTRRTRPPPTACSTCAS